MTTTDCTAPAGLTAPECPSARHIEYVWGTAVTIDLRDVDGTWPTQDRMASAIAEASAHLQRIDHVFSTYRPDSLVSRMRRGELTATSLADGANDDDAALLLEVMAACEAGRELTEGAFDPWAVAGGFDPSGYVKGWAAQTVAEMLVQRGLENVCVNAAGDLATRGLADTGTPWSVGVPHPDDATSLVHSFALNDAAAATSGLSERGAHIVLPGDRWTGYGARQATVSGPDAGWCEILSTGLMVAGRYGLDWFSQLHGYSAFCVDATAERVFRIE